MIEKAAYQLSTATWKIIYCHLLSLQASSLDIDMSVSEAAFHIFEHKGSFLSEMLQFIHVFTFFCRYCSVVCCCPFFRPMPQYVHFLACLCRTPVPDTYFLFLYCYPSLKQPEVDIPYKGEEKSKEPACFGDKIEVSLSAFGFVPESQRNEKMALR